MVMKAANIIMVELAKPAKAPLISVMPVTTNKSRSIRESVSHNQDNHEDGDPQGDNHLKCHK